MKYIIMCLMLLYVMPVRADMSEKIDRAIVHIITKGFPHLQIHPRQNHPLIKDAEKRTRLVNGIYSASQKYHIDPYLMVAIAFRESSFYNEKKGRLEEQSTFQMIKSVAKTVKRIEPLCNLTTYEGSAMCCATWLHHWKNNCKKKSIESAIAIYAGSNCDPVNAKIKWIIKDRLRIARLLKSIVTQ